VHNYYLACRYITVDGKTKLLFGIIELSILHNKFVIASIILLAMISSIIAYKRNETQKKIIVSLILSAIGIILLFVRIWKLMV
jgi:hypothetical protein